MAIETDIAVMDETQWSRLTDLFDQLLSGADPDRVLASEPDPEIRSAAANLWHHHVRADHEGYLAAPVELQIEPMFRAGQRLLNRFRIEEMLGSGGMGEVYLARDERMEETVALKTIARLLSPSPSIRRRFITEVQSARRVTHPNVCRIYELFEDGQTVFFSMEYLQGVLLSNVLDSDFAARHARSIVRQMAHALRSAHQTGVVHGDFKPQNVMIVSNAGAPEEVPRAVIMDFGLARGLHHTGAPAEQDLSVRAGTIDYMALELHAGGPPTIVSDIFAFGKVARELLPKEHVWDECTRVRPQDRPSSLDTVIRRLEPRSSRRYWLAGLAIASAGAARYVFEPSAENEVRLPANARILVNGFRTIVGQLPGAQLARSLLLTALQQSPRIHAIADQDLLPALRRLQPGGSLPLSDGVLKKISEQLRAAFWIEGDVRESGGRYSLDLQLTSASGQRVIASSAFHDVPNVTALAQAAAVWVRKTAGESGRSLLANSADVGSYTSEIPEALQRYYDAMEHYAVGEMDQAVPLLRDAVRLDPRFAQAHNMLALNVNASQQYEEGFHEIELAMGLAGKLPDRERLLIETNYYRMTQDPLKMVDAAKRSLAYHPDEPRCHGAVGERLADSGHGAEAVPFYRNALNLAPNDWMLILLLQYALVQSAQFHQAVDELQAALARGVPNKWIYRGAGCAYVGLEQYEDAARAFEAEPPGFGHTRDIQATKVLEGHLDTAIAAMQEQRAGARNPIEAHLASEFLCALYFLTDRHEAALRHVREMAGLAAYPPMTRYLDCTASWARRLNDHETLARVRASAGHIAQHWPNAHTQAVEMHIRALELWQSNMLENAEELLLRSSGSAVSVWTLFDLAEFFTLRAKWDLAQAYWDKFDLNRGTVIVNGWSPGIFVLSWYYRAAAAHGQNDRHLAFQYSQKVLDHWSRLNPGLHIVQAARNINVVSKPF